MPQCRGLILALVPLLGGCMLPPYQHPAGFSSTYFRHLHAAQPIPPVAMWLPPSRPAQAAPPAAIDEAPEPVIMHPLLID